MYIWYVCIFLMWITVHLLTPKFHLHFISQSHFCCVVSFSFIFSSDNSSKNGKGQPWYKHDCCCSMAAPGHYWNTLMLLCQARNWEPKAHLPPQPLLCQERPNCPGARKDELLLCLCIPPGCQHQWKPNTHFQKIFFPLKLSGHSPSFAYKLSKNLLICPALHCTFTPQETQSQVSTHPCTEPRPRASPPCRVFTVDTRTWQHCRARRNTCQQHWYVKENYWESFDFSDLKARKRDHIVWWNLTVNLREAVCSLCKRYQIPMIIPDHKNFIC